MFVNDQTWSKMLSEAMWISIGDARCKVPKLLHLIALKVHAFEAQPCGAIHERLPGRRRSD
jgi:hypothetical protein